MTIVLFKNMNAMLIWSGQLMNRLDFFNKLDLEILHSELQN